MSIGEGKNVNQHLCFYAKQNRSPLWSTTFGGWGVCFSDPIWGNLLLVGSPKAICSWVRSQTKSGSKLPNTMTVRPRDQSTLPRTVLQGSHPGAKARASERAPSGWALAHEAPPGIVEWNSYIGLLSCELTNHRSDHRGFGALLTWWQSKAGPWRSYLWLPNCKNNIFGVCETVLWWLFCKERNCRSHCDALWSSRIK